MTTNSPSKLTPRLHGFQGLTFALEPHKRGICLSELNYQFYTKADTGQQKK